MPKVLTNLTKAPRITTPVLSAALACPSSLDTVQGVTSSLNANSVFRHLDIPTCPDGGWIRGVCQHGATRWIKMSCKRRTCLACAEVRKWRIAARISAGMLLLAGEGTKEAGAGWMVGTFAWNIPKAEAVKVSNQFVQYLTRFFKRVHKLAVSWVKVWEEHRSGRLHLNLLVSPWRFVPKELLTRKWHTFGGGTNFKVYRVGKGEPRQASASRWKCGIYFGKYDQMVEHGRGIAYSKNWPKLREPLQSPRIGEIVWQFVGNYSVDGIEHWYDHELGRWVEVAEGEYKCIDGETCDCFEFRVSDAMRARAIIKRVRDNGG